jgi:hypothetical protein
MAGTTLAGQLSRPCASGIGFALATEADEAEIRRLLRENPMTGQVTLSLEREPHYFADVPHQAGWQQTIVTYEGERVVCVGNCSVRLRFVNGQPRRVGYLGGLRLGAKLAGRFDILRRGYEFFHQLESLDRPDCYFTSIATDNTRAIRFLERGLPGMPVYKFISGFVTALIPVPHRGVVQSDQSLKVQESEACELPTFLNEHGRHHQFAPCWTADELLALEPLGLQLDDFRVVRDGSKIIAAAALWDQRSFKQVVIRGYSGPLAWGRTGINLVASLAGGPRLPAIGTTLAHGVVSHLAVPPDQPAALISLVKSLFPIAAAKGLDFLTLGFAAEDPRLATIRSRFKCREYHSRLYSVFWPEMAGAITLDHRSPAPEVALL